MDLLSWKTSDTNQVIENIFSADAVKPVYLIQPNGKQPILETAYEGFAEFGGTNAFVWLAETNLDVNVAARLNQDQLLLIGAGLHNGVSFYSDAGGQTYATKLAAFTLNAHCGKDDIIAFDDYSDQLSVGGITASIHHHILVGRLTKQPTPAVAYPLKFSFSGDQSYSTLPAAQQYNLH